MCLRIAKFDLLNEMIVVAALLHFPSGKFFLFVTSGGIGVPNPNKIALDENQFF